MICRFVSYVLIPGACLGEQAAWTGQFAAQEDVIILCMLSDLKMQF